MVGMEHGARRERARLKTWLPKLCRYVVDVDAVDVKDPHPRTVVRELDEVGGCVQGLRAGQHFSRGRIEQTYAAPPITPVQPAGQKRHKLCERFRRPRVMADIGNDCLAAARKTV